ncbi:MULTISPECIES: alpha/beta fold hydrolase [unclassified Streptomyces]|uniref:alpha/beta fold hydrolase n=1 Tax=Streptomyces TaxID=1883 RepID=UPI0001C189A4|nr:MULTISPECIES: alpha/beta fold hydrolase [unclassified Streptomyces]AEN12509.1 alpha/beta hydrolase fold protein [Streptomyces sp. SirexAA-E]MYR69900.1 alpha/beta fold hydrolase [Streptomyces sp. SID4939]MYS01185.1 alpha/beta fold hydrolase [Streptomyces sp. SID4940]MYT62950.1 alpha/beta fold hydrolase [Streptomyces sp. SID8357]MYT88774.1 alpha/beta fold hydrolase [Streptomyces sp. SID8360]
MSDDWILDRTFDSSSGEVRWAVLGPADAPPVVLVHGTPFSSYVWRGIARALAQDHRVHVWDLPGYGVSARYEGQDVSLGAQGRVLTELLGHWELPEPAVVAHDFGGCVALRAHLLHGARYRRLALVDPVALAPWGSPAYRLLGGRSDAFGALPAALHRALVKEYVSSASHPGLRPDVLDRLVDPWCTPAGQPAFYRQIAQNDQRFTDEIQGRYGELDLPVLICWGTEDTWIPVARAHELAALVPDAELRLIDGAGHLVQEDAPAELTAALTRFLRTAP